MRTLTFSSSRMIQSILLLIAFAFIQTTSTAQSWIQLGIDIDGEAASDFSGRAVCSSADGLTFAIGAPENDGNGTNAGHVRVYKLISGVWTQLGADIDGEAANDKFGGCVSLSADGSILAIGARSNDGTGSNAGHVRVYKFISGIWTQQGADIDGEAAGDFSGSSIDLSADGLTLAVGATNNNENGTNAGHVRVYSFLSGVWMQQSADIDGEATGDKSGFSVSLSADGSILAIGAKENDANGTNAGHVRVYAFLSGVWMQQGADIDGETAGDKSGGSVSLSADGSILVIGATNNEGNGLFAGHVRMYKFLSGIWTQQGDDIDGEAAGDFSGGSVSLSADGSTLAIGAFGSDFNGSETGHVRVYKFLSGVWTQQGVDIDGEAAGDASGGSVSLSEDGLTLAIGASSNDGSGNSAGHVRVFGFGINIGLDDYSALYGISIFPNPTNKDVTIELGKLKDVTVQVFNIKGQLVYNKKSINTEAFQFELNEPTGTYILELSRLGETQQYKLMKE